MIDGWISIHRKIQTHWVWQDKPFTKGQAWIDILMEVNHEPQKVLIKNQLIFCDRGESLNSLETWARRWGWGKSRVQRFLILLKNDMMIELKSTHKSTHLKVLHYSKYQNLRNANETKMKRKRNKDETQVKLNNKDNNDNKENKKEKLIKEKNSIKNKLTQIWEKNFSYYQEKYPNRNYNLEYRSMLDWIDRKISEARKRRDWNLFIEGWLNRAKIDYSKSINIPEPEELTKEQQYEERKERIKKLQTEGKGDSDECQRCIRLNKAYEEMHPE